MVFLIWRNQLCLPIELRLFARQSFAPVAVTRFQHGERLCRVQAYTIRRIELRERLQR
jgi:hypothetical protein